MGAKMKHADDVEHRFNGSLLQRARRTSARTANARRFLSEITLR